MFYDILQMMRNVSAMAVLNQSEQVKYIIPLEFFFSTLQILPHKLLYDFFFADAPGLT